MSGPIDVSIYTDVSDVVSGAEKVADSFENIDDALKDTAKAGDKAFESLEDSADKAFKSIESSAKEAEGTIDRDLTQQLKKAEDAAESTGKSGKKIGDGVEEGTSRGRAALNDLRDEANSTAAEAGASFDGSADSISDAFQEVAANMGPIGIAAAVGIGIAIAKMQELAEANNEASQASIDLAKEIYEVGGAMDAVDLAAKVQEWAFSLGAEDNWLTPWADESISNIERVKNFAGENKDLAKAIFDSFEGDADKAAAGFDKITEAINRDKEALKDHVSYYDENGQAVYTKQGDAINDRIKTGEELKKSLEEERKKSGDAADSNKYYTDIMGESEEATKKRKDAEDELLKVQQDRIEAEEKLSETNRSAVENEIDYNQTLKETADGIATRGKATDTLTKAGQDNNTALLDLVGTGSDYLQGLYDQGAGADTLAAKVTAVRDQFIAQAEAAGYTRGEAEKLATTYGLVPPEVNTKITSEGGPEAKAAVTDAAADQTATVDVKAEGVPVAQGEITGVEGKDVGINVTTENTDVQTQGRVDGIKGKDVKIDVQDFNTVSQTQTRIDGIRGRDVDIHVRLTNLDAVENRLALLAMPRTAYIDIKQRSGQEAP